MHGQRSVFLLGPNSAVRFRNGVFFVVDQLWSISDCEVWSRGVDVHSEE